MGSRIHPADFAEQDIAARFVAARQAGASLAAFPGTIPATLADAYRVQDAGIARVNDTIGGWKVGRILPPQSTQFGADRLAGPIFSRAIQHAAAGISSTGSIYAGGFGAAEAELLLRLGHAPAPGQTQFTLEEAAALIDSVHVGLEIASSPLATINELGPPVIISDFGNNNGLIIGPEIANWATRNVADLPVAMLIDGVQVGRGSAAVFTDGPVGSVRFLLELMAQRGIDLAPGTWISSGAITGVHDVKAGQRVEARFGDGLSIGCTISHMPQTAHVAPPTA